MLFITLLCVSYSKSNNDLFYSSFIEVTSESTLLAKPEGKKIQGKMNIDGSSYSAICDCSPIAPNKDMQKVNSDNSPKCDPAKLKIMNEKTGLGSTITDIRTLVGNIQDLKYINVENSEFSCLDGRTNQNVLASPGGDAGDFILALMVYEDLLGGGRKLTVDNVEIFFTQYLKLMKPKKFVMCTDDIALYHIEKDLLVRLFLQ